MNRSSLYHIINIPSNSLKPLLIITLALWYNSVIGSNCFPALHLCTILIINHSKTQKHQVPVKTQIKIWLMLTKAYQSGTSCTTRSTLERYPWALHRPLLGSEGLCCSLSSVRESNVSVCIEQIVIRQVKSEKTDLCTAPAPVLYPVNDLRPHSPHWTLLTCIP